MGKTFQDLVLWAEKELGYCEAEVKVAIKAAGLTHFYIAAYLDYQKILRDDKSQKDELAFKCPICGAAIVHCKDNDGKFGAHWGWTCTADPKPFIRYRLQLLKPKYAALAAFYEQVYGNPLPSGVVVEVIENA